MFHDVKETDGKARDLSDSGQRLDNSFYNATIRVNIRVTGGITTDLLALFCGAMWAHKTWLPWRSMEGTVLAAVIFQCLSVLGVVASGTDLSHHQDGLTSQLQWKLHMNGDMEPSKFQRSFV